MNEKEERLDSPNPSQEINSPVWQLGDSKYAQWEDSVPSILATLAQRGHGEPSVQQSRDQNHMAQPG